MTATARAVRASGSRPRSFRSSTIASRAASRASARCAAWPFQCAALSGSAYGRSKSPSSSLARSTRLTLASITESGTSPRRNASQYGRCCGNDDWKTTSSPASKACRAAVGVSGSVMCSTVAPPVAAASEMTNPSNPHAPFSVSASSRRLCVAGTPSTEL